MASASSKCSDDELQQRGFANATHLASSGIKMIIVGCGFAGLACAIESVRKGHSVVILEKYKEVKMLGTLICYAFPFSSVVMNMEFIPGDVRIFC